MMRGLAPCILSALLIAACATTTRAPRTSPHAKPVADGAPAQSASFPIPVPMPARYLRTLEIDPQGYAPGKQAESSDLLLGDLLFHAPSTLGAKARELGVSCNSCHPNGATHTRFFIDEVSDRAGNVDLSTSFFAKAADDGVKNAISIPSLRGCRFTGPYGLDGRTASLPDFVQSVVTSEFAGTPLGPRELAALIRYVQELDFLPNQNLDGRGNLTTHASQAAHRGALLFIEPRRGFSGMSCASCHAPTSFFRDGRVHRLGTGSPPSPHAVDGGYETPTLLSLAETAPYFHDGRFATVGDVVAWFDRAFTLGLAPRDRDDLTAYVEAVGAVDRVRDDRPLARKLDETFAYASLLTTEHSRITWLSAIDAIVRALEKPPPRVAERASLLRTKLARIRATQAGDAIEPLDVRALRVDLSRLAADWAGAVTREGGSLD
jgi:cytochrome c peroxidase